MSARRVLAIARRVMLQVLHDRRTVALLIVVPILLLGLGAILFRAKPAPIPLGVVDEDQGVVIPLVGSTSIAERITSELTAGNAFALVKLDASQVDASLRNGKVQGVVTFPNDFSSAFLSHHQAELDLRLEGSNPSQSVAITTRVTQAATKALAELAAVEIGGASAGQSAALPLALHVSYLFAGPEFDAMDYVAPVYIAFLALFFVFLLTCVSFLRERSQGTMERLMATPATRLELVLGYMAGLGLFALIQVAVILSFTVWVIKIHYLGSLALLFLIVALLAEVGVSLGILASVFARTEFQVLQFIPLLILPQILLGGTFFAVNDMPSYLQPFAYLMPITYANRALRDTMLRGYGLSEIWANVLILFGFVVVLIALGALATRREVA